MKLLFRQRIFSWFDSYDIYNEEGGVAFNVEGKLSWGHRLEIHDPAGNHVGTVKEVVPSFLPRCSLYGADGECLGQIRKEFSLFKPVYTLDCRDWVVNGDFLGWDYRVTDSAGREILTATKELFHMSDVYSMDIPDRQNALLCLMIVLAIDIARDRRN